MIRRLLRWCGYKPAVVKRLERLCRQARQEEQQAQRVLARVRRAA